MRRTSVALFAVALSLLAPGAAGGKAPSYADLVNSCGTRVDLCPDHYGSGCQPNRCRDLIAEIAAGTATEQQYSEECGDACPDKTAIYLRLENKWRSLVDEYNPCTDTFPALEDPPSADGCPRAVQEHRGRLLSLRCQLAFKRQQAKCPKPQACPVEGREFNRVANPDRRFCLFEHDGRYSAYECRQQSVGDPGTGAECATSATEAESESGCDEIPALQDVDLFGAIREHTGDDLAQVLEVEPVWRDDSESLLDQVVSRIHQGEIRTHRTRQWETLPVRLDTGQFLREQSGVFVWFRANGEVYRQQLHPDGSESAIEPVAWPNAERFFGLSACELDDQTKLFQVDWLEIEKLLSQSERGWRPLAQGGFLSKVDGTMIQTRCYQAVDGAISCYALERATDYRSQEHNEPNIRAWDPDRWAWEAVGDPVALRAVQRSLVRAIVEIPGGAPFYVFALRATDTRNAGMLVRNGTMEIWTEGSAETWSSHPISELLRKGLTERLAKRTFDSDSYLRSLLQGKLNAPEVRLLIDEEPRYCWLDSRRIVCSNAHWEGQEVLSRDEYWLDWPEASMDKIYRSLLTTEPSLGALGSALELSLGRSEPTRWLAVVDGPESGGGFFEESLQTHFEDGLCQRTVANWPGPPHLEAPPVEIVVAAEAGVECETRVRSSFRRLFRLVRRASRPALAKHDLRLYLSRSEPLVVALYRAGASSTLEIYKLQEIPGSPSLVAECIYGPVDTRALSMFLMRQHQVKWDPDDPAQLEVIARCVANDDDDCLGLDQSMQTIARKYAPRSCAAPTTRENGNEAFDRN